MGHIQRNGLIYEAGIWDTFRGINFLAQKDKSLYRWASI